MDGDPALWRGIGSFQLQSPLAGNFFGHSQQSEIFRAEPDRPGHLNFQEKCFEQSGPADFCDPGPIQIDRRIAYGEFHPAVMHQLGKGVGGVDPEQPVETDVQGF